jgi:hypothetical protein
MKAAVSQSSLLRTGDVPLTIAHPDGSRCLALNTAKYVSMAAGVGIYSPS